MKRLRILALSLILTVIVGPIVFASDITGSKFYANILISNNGTATTNVAVPVFSINSTVMIDGLYMNATANNTVLRNTSGADLAFSPGYDPTLPWIIWVPSIGADGYLSEVLFLADSSGGKLAYFPGLAGMISADNDTLLELSGNFSIEQKGFIDTSVAADKNLIIKDDAIKVYISGTGNITATLTGDPVEFIILDDDQFATNNSPTRAFAQTFTTAGAITVNAVKVKVYSDGDPGTVTYEIWPTVAGKPAGALLTSGSFEGGPLGGNPGEWVTFNVTPYALDAATLYGLVIRTPGAGVGNNMYWRKDDSAPAYPDGAGYWTNDGLPPWNADNSDALFSIINSVSITATGVTTDEHTVKVHLASGNFSIDIDGTNEDYASSSAVPNTSGNYSYVQNNAMLYMESTTITIGGDLRQDIVWQYDDTVFTDQSGNDQHAYPTFRTTSSDANVSANMTSLTPVSEAKAPQYALGAGPPFFTVGNVTGLFTTVPPTGGFPLAGVIAAVAGATSTPPQLPLLIIACFVILAASLTTSYTLRKYGSGSILIKCLVIVCFLGIFIGIKNFGIDFWMLICFGIFAVGLCMMSRQQGWN